MRPTHSEIIAGVRRILADVVEPEVTSDYARARLREVRAVLAQVDWDEAAPRLGERVAELRSTLDDCRDWIDSDPARCAHFGRSGVAFPDARAEASTFAELNANSAACAGAVVALIAPWEDWLADHPDDETGHRLRRRLLELSAR